MFAVPLALAVKLPVAVMLVMAISFAAFISASLVLTVFTAILPEVLVKVVLLAEFIAVFPMLRLFVANTVTEPLFIELMEFFISGLLVPDLSLMAKAVKVTVFPLIADGVKILFSTFPKTILLPLILRSPAEFNVPTVALLLAIIANGAVSACRSLVEVFVALIVPKTDTSCEAAI